MSCLVIAARCLLVFVFCLSFGGGASAVVRRDDRPDSFYRQLGNQAAFRSAGRVEVDYGRGFQSIGTATLYGPNRLISAAHVFDDSSLFGASRMRVNFGGGRIQAIDFLTPGVVNLNPGYRPSSLRNDLAAVFLPQSFNLKPAPLYSGRRVRLDRPITFVGYGNTGTGLTGSRKFSGRKRGGENALGRYVGGGRSFEVDFDRAGTARFNNLGSSRALELEGLLGAGDSGGSAWVKKGGRWKLVGINSYGLDWNVGGRGNGVEDDYGDRSGFVYLPKYAAWLRSLDAPAILPGEIAAVPEPGPLALLLAAGLAAAGWHRRRRA